MNQEDFTQRLNYSNETETVFNGLASEENPDSDKDGRHPHKENVLHFRKIAESEKKSLEFNNRLLVNIVNFLNRKNFDVIFLTQSSSIPYGVILKEAYKIAFPDKKQPKFLTVNPKKVRELQKDWEWRKRMYNEYTIETGQPAPEEDANQTGILSTETKDLKKFINTKIQENPDVLKAKEEIEQSCKKHIKDGDRVFVFDEAGNGMSSLIAERFIKEAVEDLGKKVEIENIEGEVGLPGFQGIGPWVSRPTSGYRGSVNEENSFTPYVGSDVLRPRNKEERQIVLENLKYLKQIGRDLGEQIKLKSEKQSIN